MKALLAAAATVVLLFTAYAKAAELHQLTLLDGEVTPS